MEETRYVEFTNHWPDGTPSIYEKLLLFAWEEKRADM